MHLSHVCLRRKYIIMSSNFWPHRVNTYTYLANVLNSRLTITCIASFPLSFLIFLSLFFLLSFFSHPTRVWVFISLHFIFQFSVFNQYLYLSVRILFYVSVLTFWTCEAANVLFCSGSDDSRKLHSTLRDRVEHDQF
jgi:hypothetical protein